MKRRANLLLVKAGLLAAATLLAWVIAVACALVFYGPEAWTPVIDGVTPWRTLGAGVLLAGCLAGAGWWRLAARLHAPAPELSGFLRIGIVVCAIPLALLGGMLLFLGPWAVSAEDEASAYEFEVVRRPGGILAVGDIGPGFAAALEGALEVAPRAPVIEITSAGGLIDEALAASRLIEAAKATVIAREQCDSACLVVLMAGARRFADRDLELGFHAGAPLGVDSPRVIEHLAQKADAEADAYLLKRGAPRSAIQAARRKGPDEIHYVAARDLERQGVLRTLPAGAAPY